MTNTTNPNLGPLILGGPANANSGTNSTTNVGLRPQLGIQGLSGLFGSGLGAQGGGYLTGNNLGNTNSIPTAFQTGNLTAYEGYLGGGFGGPGALGTNGIAGIQGALGGGLGAFALGGGMSGGLPGLGGMGGFGGVPNVGGFGAPFVGGFGGFGGFGCAVPSAFPGQLPFPLVP